MGFRLMYEFDYALPFQELARVLEALAYFAEPPGSGTVPDTFHLEEAGYPLPAGISICFWCSLISGVWHGANITFVIWGALPLGTYIIPFSYRNTKILETNWSDGLGLSRISLAV